MRAAGSSTGWWLGACCAAALLLLAVSARLLLRRPAAPPSRPAAPLRAPAACDAPRALALRTLPEAEHAPVLLAAEPGVRLRVDGARVDGARGDGAKMEGAPVDAALRLPAGEHTVRAEADGAAPLEWRLRFDAYTPALLHAQRYAGAGLTLVALGAVCMSCPAPLRPESLAPRRAAQPPAVLLAEAAARLRSGDWPAAAGALRGVAGAARGQALYLRLAAGVYAASLQPQAARRALAALPREEAGALPGLLRQLQQRGPQEAKRRGEVTLARWNRLTERYAALVQRFEPQAPAQVAGAGKRLEALSTAFEAAARARDDEGMERALEAAEAALGTLVAQVRGARPDDCAFQAEVVATVSATAAAPPPEQEGAHGE